MLAKIAAGVLIFISSCIMAAMLLVYHTGVVFIELEEKASDGHHIYLPIPVILAHMVVALVPEKEMREVRADLAPHRDLLMAAVNEIANCPDGPLVEFTSSEEELSIVKEGAYLKLDLDSGEEKVKVSVPLGSVRNLVRQLVY